MQSQPATKLARTVSLRLKLVYWDRWRHAIQRDGPKYQRKISKVKPEVAFNYPGQYWRDPDWIKNLILFFDGIAMLIPEYIRVSGKFDDEPIIVSLKEHGLFQVIRPEESVGKQETEQLAEAFVEIITSGRLDHLTKKPVSRADRSSFGSLSRSRLGHNGDNELADLIFKELKERNLADDSEDGVSIPMHMTVCALVLILLAQILRSRGESMGVTLSPVTDRAHLVTGLSEIIASPTSSPSSVGEIVSFDMAMVGVDLASIPMDEVLDFRRQNYSLHRNYSISVRTFARDLSFMPADEREAEFEKRQDELDDAARAIKKANWKAWRSPASFGISLMGAAWAFYSGDPITAAIVGAGALIGFPSDTAVDLGVYSYLFSAQ